MHDASIVIVTRGRRAIAARAIASALAQEGDIEVIVVDDGSPHDTSDYVRQHFPRARLIQHQDQAGYIVRRNEGAQAADGRIIFSIDDDAEFIDPRVVADTLPFFSDPQIGAVAIPHVNISPDGAESFMFSPAPANQNAYITSSFIGTAYAIRRDIFLGIGGFLERFFHWGEESEYCQRLWAAGYAVRLGNAVRIRHYPAGVGKYVPRINRYVFRNRLLSVWLNAPNLYVLPLLAARTLSTIGQIIRFRQPSAALQGLFMGYWEILSSLRKRKPIPKKHFDVWVSIHRKRCVEFDEKIRSALPSATVTASAPD